MKRIAPSDDYLKKAQQLSSEDIERLAARMRGRFTRRLEDKTLTLMEVLALQLEYEDEQMADWRKQIAKIRQKHPELGAFYEHRVE